LALLWEYAIEHFFIELLNLARSVGHDIAEVEFLEWVETLKRCTDVDSCPLLPLLSYFDDGFPNFSDSSVASDDLTLTFLNDYFASRNNENIRSLYGLSRSIVCTFFANIV
jgi:hypothetical protein